MWCIPHWCRSLVDAEGFPGVPGQWMSHGLDSFMDRCLRMTAGHRVWERKGMTEAEKNGRVWCQPALQIEHRPGDMQWHLQQWHLEGQPMTNGCLRDLIQGPVTTAIP